MIQKYLNKIKKLPHVMQFFKYIIVWGIMLIFNLMLVWIFMKFLDFSFITSSSIAFVLESIVAFFVNRSWTFKSDIHFLKGYFRFFTIALYSFIFVMISTYCMIHLLDIQYLSSRTISTFVAWFLGYLLDLRISFRV